MVEKMTGAYLPGNSTVEFKELDIPTPVHGEVSGADWFCKLFAEK